MKECVENYGSQLLCLGCLRGKELKVSTEGALKNRNNVGSVYMFAHAVTFSFSFLSWKEGTIKLLLSGLAYRNALSASRSPRFLSSTPPLLPLRSFPERD